MTRCKYLVILLLVVLAAACSEGKQGQPAQSLPDNPENRTAAAKRFLETMPPKDLLQGMANRVMPTLPEKEQKPFMDAITSQAVEQVVYRISLDSLVQDFTVGELNAMTAFYGSPEGQSAYKKFPTYMRQIMPQIQQEVRKALEVAQKQEGTKPGGPKGQPEITIEPVPQAPSVTKPTPQQKAKTVPPAAKEPKEQKQPAAPPGKQ